MTLTSLSPTRIITRPRRCLDCHRILSTPGHLCPACQEIQERGDAADKYRYAILAMMQSDSDRWIASAMLRKVILRSGYSSPLILQAVADRAAWLEPVTYSGVCEIAAEEASALGFEFPIW